VTIETERLRLRPTEAARACLEWARASLTVPYLTAMINPDNHASARLAHRLGMAPLREDVLLGDPVVVYGIDCAAEPGSGSEALREVAEEIAVSTGGPYTEREISEVRRWLPSPASPAG
jgi:hypothetical protein